MNKIKIKDKLYDYEIIRKANKNVYIRFKNNVFIVSAPYLVSEEKIKEIFKRDEEKLYKMANPSLKPKLTYQKGIKKTILGKEYTLNYADKTYVKDDVLFLNKNNPKEALLNYVEPLLLDYLKERVYYLYHYTYSGNAVPLVEVKAVKTYYGQYNWKYYTIAFNTILAFAPLELIDYVIIHELCHIKYHNHQKGFYTLLESLLPDYKKLQERLRKEVETL